MDQSIVYGVAVLPAIIGLVQVSKDLGMNSRFAPALSVLLGVVASIAETVARHQPASSDWVQAGFVGVALGLAAAGLYSGMRTVLPAASEPQSGGTPAGQGSH